ncbi:uncharacterized protein LOC111894844 [Lactuca sativa]|uniref:uncharacterized protein LOC111894844 n=1 Tax=Lactuca sativa TaxID=4236 RepID=UPI000CD8D312|nr:uncharacterized protein LOC111894844 [Lactuca sativa]
MGKMKTLDYFYKRKVDDKETNHQSEESKRHKASTSEPQPQEIENQQENESQLQENDKQQENKPQPQEKENPNEFDLKNLERDPAKRKQMWDYPVNLREQLEYSPTTYASYCFICYIFNDKPSVCHGYDAFTVKGFDNWKKVNDGKNCAFLKHIGCSQHRNVVAYAENLMNQAAHIENIIVKQNEAQILKNRLRLKVSIDTVRWLTFQACALRGHDETPDSKNRGNFLQLLKLLASYNDEVANIVLEKATYNSKYTSGEIQKEILSIIANKVRKHIRSEVGDSYFCVMIDESRDESQKEKIVIVLRFIDAEGIIRERFLDLVHVRDTLSLTLKTNMWRQLLHYQFDVSKICGQCYNGASNMREEWNGLQALVLEDCLYAYYVHCFAHRLQLALVAASREIILVHHFFTNLIFTINVVCASSKRHDELQKAKATEIEQLLELCEIESAALDKQLHELNSRFNDRAMELLRLSSTLVSKVINVDQICLLVEKYYPKDFTEQEMIQLRYQLEIFNIDITKNPRLNGVSTIADLCKRLVETQKRETYYLLDRVVRLILTLPVSTATTEKGFLAMKIFKNRLRFKMSDDFHANNLVIYIEREIAEKLI